MNVQVRPQVLRWARERAELAPNELARRVGLSLARIEEWERSGELSLAHLERLAAKTYTPVGYFFLETPPEEDLPIADFRSPSSSRGEAPSPELIDTLTICQQRQRWFREYATGEGEEPLSFVGSADVGDPVTRLADTIRAELGLTTAARREARSWEEALTAMYSAAEDAGILVMRNGVVGNNTHRKLDVAEFRGFALSDEYAPLIFVNAVDSKSAQMFTLAHELCHVWLGASALTDASPTNTIPIERYCNAVAAEILVPQSDFRQAWQELNQSADRIALLARRFKVSTLVILIRSREADLLPEAVFSELYNTEIERAEKTGGTGGDFYRTQNSRLGRRFARAVVASALEGRTTYKEAYQLLGVKKAATFTELARHLGVIA